ncbi:MAG: AIR carboxylase family protein, partial [Candidatus Ornithospirochaeta sp.]
MKTDTKRILEAVKSGELSIDDALLALKKEPFEDIGYAKIDLHRSLRQGMPEVIYGESKTSKQIIGIVEKMLENDQENILITRLSQDKADDIKALYDMTYYEEARIGILGKMPEATGIGKIVVATGGTSDIPVAEEAALTAEVFKNEVVRLYDVGVAGLHRLLA